MKKITKRFLNGNLVELNIYGTAQEIEQELNALYNSKALDVAIEPQEPCTSVYLSRAAWLKGLELRMSFSLESQFANFKGKAGGAIDLIRAKVREYVDSLPVESAPVSSWVFLSGVDFNQIGHLEQDLAEINSQI